MMKFPPLDNLKAVLCDDKLCGDLNCEDCVLSTDSGFKLTVTATKEEVITLEGGKK